MDAASLRSFLLAHPDDFTPDDFGARTGLDPGSALAALADLEGEGYVRTLDGGETFLTGPQGEAVVRAHPGGKYRKPFLREEVAGLALRIVRSCRRASFNLFFPAKVAVYGSYLEPGARVLGDLDIAVEFRYLFEGEPPDERRGRVVQRAAELGRHFLLDEWPSAEAYLRGVSEASFKGDAPWLDVEEYETVRAWDPPRTMVIADVDAPGEKGGQYRNVLDDLRIDHVARYGTAT